MVFSSTMIDTTTTRNHIMFYLTILFFDTLLIIIKSIKISIKKEMILSIGTPLELVYVMLY